MARRRLPFDIDVDVRTDELSMEALLCRAAGHAWILKAMGRKRYTELINSGCWEWERYCGNGCGCTWRQMFNARTGELIENERHYPSGGTYLLKPRSGRLRREAARGAFVARQFA